MSIGALGKRTDETHGSRDGSGPACGKATAGKVTSGETMSSKATRGTRGKATMGEATHGRESTRRPAGRSALPDAAMRCGRWFRQHARALCVIVLVVCAIEIFGFNHYFWSTLGNTPIEQPTVTFDDGSDFEYGTVYTDDSIKITVYPTSDKNGLADIDSIDLKVVQTPGRIDGAVKYYSLRSLDDQCHLAEKITVYDEGHAGGYTIDSTPHTTVSMPGMDANGTDNYGSDIVCPAVQPSMYKALHAAGKVSKIELEFKDAIMPDNSMRIDAITLNERVPMRFNVLRALLMFLVAAGLLALFARHSGRTEALIAGLVPVDGASATAGTADSGGNGKKGGDAARWEIAERDGDASRDLEPRWRIVWTATLLASVAAAILLQSQSVEINVFPAYSQLARSFAEGRITIDYPHGADKASIISSMANPYDKNERYALAAPLTWDIAFYGGKFYLYFGVVPVLVLFLPWYLLTGRDLASIPAQCVFDAFIVVGMFLLVNELRRRLCPSMPRGLFLLLSALAPAAILNLMVKTASVHAVASASGLAFVVWGLWLWVRSVRGVGADGSGLSVWRAAVGSLCMALAVGCRPTMALYSLLAFPVFWRVLRRPRANWWRVLAAAAPYVPVAAGLMWYNAARFGSPFEFGAKYQLTGGDVLHQGVHLSRIPMSLWYYLFMTPQLTPEFPYITGIPVTSRYSGFIDVWFVRGGLFFTIPLLLLALVPAAVKKLKNTRGLYSMCMVLAVIAVCVETVFGAIFTRYQADVVPFLMVAALCVIMEWMRDAAWHRDASEIAWRYRVVCGLAVVTAFALLLGLFCIDEEGTTTPFGNYVFYFRVWDFFDFLKY